LQLSRVVTGEVMAQVFGEWRSGHSRNGGGLVWFFKDLWPGAGWGIVDSLGRPKAAYYSLRRAWANLQITLTDEALDGLHVHVMNETAEPFRGLVEVLLLQEQHIVVARRAVEWTLQPRETRTMSADEILDAFYDVTYAYRFGPPKHDVAIATLLDEEGAARSEAFYFVERREPSPVSGGNLEIQVVPLAEHRYSVTFRGDRFLESMHLSADGFLPEDNYFHLVPGRTKTVTFRPFGSERRRFAGYAEALNLKDAVRFTAK
jgi:beta-mannosidase